MKKHVYLTRKKLQQSIPRYGHFALHNYYARSIIKSENPVFSNPTSLYYLTKKREAFFMKKSVRTFLIVIVALIILFLAAAAGFLFGRQRFLRPESHTFYAWIENMDENSMTVQGLDENSVNYRGKFSLTLSEDTRFLWNNTAISPSDLTPGSRIAVSYTGLITETEPAGIREITAIELLEDDISYHPRLIFRQAEATAFASLPGYYSDYAVDLSYEDIRDILSVDELPGVEPFGAIWLGNAQFYEDGSIAVIYLRAYNSWYDANHAGVPLALIELCPGKIPAQATYYSDESATCTLWDIPVTALDTGLSHQGVYSDDGTAMEMISVNEFFLKFQSDTVGLLGNFYARDGRFDETKELMNTIIRYILNPEGNFSLDPVYKKMPDDWREDTDFTDYIPQALDNYSLNDSRYSIERDRSNSQDIESLRLHYAETPTGGGNSFRWTIQKAWQQPVDTSKKESYDLRLYDNLNFSDITLGLTGTLSSDAIETLSNPVFAIEDLTADVIASRIFTGYEPNYQQPYIRLSVLYPGNTIVGFSGHMHAEELYQIFQSVIPKTESSY